LHPLTDQVWFAKMVKICKDCHVGDCFPSDPDESGYAAYEAEQAPLRAKRAARLNAKQVAAAARLAAKSKQQPDLSAVDKTNWPVDASKSTSTNRSNRSIEEEKNEADKQNESDASEKKSPVFLLAKLYDGQLNISNLFTGSRLISIGLAKRFNWPATQPLVVSKISSFKTGTTVVEYTGEELHVGDIETWATAIRFGAKTPLEDRVPLVEREMLKAMRRGDGGMYYKVLREQITRLQGARLILKTTDMPTIQAIAIAMPEDKGVKEAIESGRLELVIPLLGGSSNGSEANKPGTVYVTVPKEVRALFGKGLSSWFDDEKYYSLRNPTARRLYLLYLRHVEPWSFTRDELREYLGATVKRDVDLHRTLMSAFRELVSQGIFTKVPEYKPCKNRYGAEAYVFDNQLPTR
jgi:hypothetical protein